MDFNIHPQNPKKITQKFMKEKHIIDMVWNLWSLFSLIYYLN